MQNIWLEKRKVLSFDQWIANGAYQRVCFLGQRQEVMIRWDIPTKRLKHRDPHICSRFCLWFQADVCTTIGCRCTESNESFHSNVRLAEVNRFVPFVLPFLAAFVADYINFELIIPNASVSKVKQYYKVLSTFHKTYGGRTEIRYGKVLFLDMSIRRQHMHLVQDLIPEGTLHLGKYKPTGWTYGKLRL